VLIPWFARLIDATPEEVFAAFIDPEGQEAFYGQDDPGWIVRSQCDLRVGGVWTVEFGPSPRELYRHWHVFEVIERPYRLVLASTETRLDGSSFHTKLEFTFEARSRKDPHDHGPAGVSHRRASRRARARAPQYFHPPGAVHSAEQRRRT
jgi:uncharacterized protein YndB with AHSA1/START domain